MARPKGFQIDGRFLKAHRENSGMTQDEFAAHCGLTRTVIQKAERNGPLAPMTIRALAAGIGCQETELLVSEDWTRTPDERHVTIFKPDAVKKIGTLWGTSRETLYQLPPMLLTVVALRNLVRVVVAYAPGTAEAEAHFMHVLSTIQISYAALTTILDGKREKVNASEIKAAADGCYLAASFARPAHYFDDIYGADAAFAVGIGAARIAEAILLQVSRDLTVEDANYWRMVEFACSAWHAAGHAGVYLTIESDYRRASTLEMHDLRNSRHYGDILAQPIWPGGEAPQALALYMDRMLTQRHFPHEVRVLWNSWVRKGFVPSGHGHQP